MNRDLAEFLGRLEPLVQIETVWRNGRLPLQVTYYLITELPPLAYISSVRAIVFRGTELLTLVDPKGEFYIIPGGRREEAETVDEVLHREVLEETGWTLGDITLLGMIHFHHLSSKPQDYPYPHPDFLQLVYVATANQFQPGKMVFDEYVVESGFRAIEEVQPLLRNPGQLLLLDAASKMVKR